MTCYETFGVLVAVDIHDFHKASQSLTERQRQTDFDDLHHEIAERDAGRNKRFLKKDDADGQTAQRRKTQELVRLTALQSLLQNDPEYAALYKATNDLLAKAEAATETALDRIETELRQAESSLQDMTDSASQLPGGQKVFKDQNGDVWTQDRQAVSSEEAESIVWKNDSPSYEDYSSQKRKTEDVRKRMEDVRQYQMDVLGKSRERMMDEDNPITQAEMEDIQENVVKNADPSIVAEISPEKPILAAKIDDVSVVAKPPI